MKRFVLVLLAFNNVANDEEECSRPVELVQGQSTRFLKARNGNYYADRRSRVEHFFRSRRRGRNRWSQAVDWVISCKNVPANDLMLASPDLLMAFVGSRRL
jgi:hypothetical protein